MTIDSTLTTSDGALCSTRFDSATGTFFVIAVHSRSRGPAAGGTRAMQYPSAAAAVRDATRLAEAMTLKMSMADLPMGGGKSVIALPVPREEIDAATWSRILAVHAENLAALGGSYWTGPDVGTCSADMDVLHAAGGFAFGRSVAAGGPGSSAPSTAHGVHAAVLGSAREAGMKGLADRRVVVQGLGAVGMEVARLAARDGARLIVSDIDPSRCREAQGMGARVVAPDEVLGEESDIFVPCATGDVIDVAVARSIRTSAVAGAANNVLRDAEAGEVLTGRGIVVAPDFVANAGGAIHLIGREVLRWSAAQVEARVRGIGETLGGVFAMARERGVSTETAAREFASKRQACI